MRKYLNCAANPRYEICGNRIKLPKPRKSVDWGIYFVTNVVKSGVYKSGEVLIGKRFLIEKSPGEKDWGDFRRRDLGTTLRDCAVVRREKRAKIVPKHPTSFFPERLFRKNHFPN